MKKHKVTIDITNNFLIFWPGYCIYIGAISFTIMSQPKLSVKTIVIRIEKHINSRKMIKKGSPKNMTDFLQMLNKLSSKKRRQINKSKKKTNIEETSSRKSIISSLDNYDKKELLISIPATKGLDPKAKDIDIAIIGTDAYDAACCLKRAKLFVVSMKNIQYPAETNLRSVVPQKYHDFPNVFLKKDLNTLLPYQKYDHKIHLEEKQELDYIPLYKISPKELDTIKRYFDSYLAKGFIQVSSSFFFLLVLFVKKPEKKI